MPKSTRNYFRLFKQAFFFNDDDRESIETAYRAACAAADAMQISHGAIVVWRMPAERGAWTPTSANRGVGVVGDLRRGVAALAN